MQNPPSQLSGGSLFAGPRHFLLLAAACAWAGSALGQNANQTVPAAAQPVSQKLNGHELSQLLAPIALYPDALIALILPASTVPSDIVLAARYLDAKGDPGLAKDHPWDESVIALTRYPELLAWMDKSLEWTASLGEAFVEQPADVMNALQALRVQAKAAGNLQDSPQQKVEEEDAVIRIVPTDPQVIYVPQYDPDLVYIQSYSSVPLLTFGVGFAVGPWLCYDFDWGRRHFYHGHWRGWDHHRDDVRAFNENLAGQQIRVINIDISNANPWLPSLISQRQIIQRQRNNIGNARFVSARSSAVAATLPAAVPGTVPGAVQPLMYNPQLKTALPRPSRLVGMPGENGRNLAPAAIPTGGLPVAPAPIPALGLKSTIPQARSRVESPATLPVTAPQSEKIRVPASNAPQVLPTDERLKKQAQPSGENLQRSRNAITPTVRPTVPAPVINVQTEQKIQKTQESIPAQTPSPQHQDVQRMRQLQEHQPTVPSSPPEQAGTKEQAPSSGGSHSKKIEKKKSAEKTSE